MNRTRRYLGVAAVAAVALGAGQLVQTMTGSDSAPRPGKIEKTAAGPEAAPAPLLPAAATLAPADAPATGPAPAAPAEETRLAALTGTPPAAPPVSLLPVPEPAPAAQDCSPKLVLKAAPQAMIALTLEAPCHPGARVVLRHAGLAVAETLDAKGRLSLDLPALETAGAVSALLPDAAVAEATVAVPDAAKLRRVAIEWMADDRFQLTAAEKGAAYGTPGFVTAENPVSPDGGYLVALGDPSLDLPMQAEIYTWPADPAVSSDPAVEAAVTDLTCGRELIGTTLLSDKGKVTLRKLSLAMPDCGALGDILVLNNLAAGTTLAAAN